MKIFLHLIIVSLIYVQAINAQPGSLDVEYGNQGIVKEPIPPYSLYISASALQKDQKLIIAGSQSDFTIKRYLTDGSVDISFGDKGTVHTYFDGVAAPNNPASILIQPDQKIIVAGSGAVSNHGTDFILARYMPDGLLDKSFGDNGKVITTHENKIISDLANAAVLQPDGSIVVGGYRTDYNQDAFQFFILKRYLPNGNIDGGFGDNGIVTTHFTDYTLDYLTSLLYQPDGKIVAGGFSGYGIGTTTNKFALCRYMLNGQPDKSFGNNSKVVSDLPEDGEELYSMVLQNDGSIVATGAAKFDYYKRLAVARYNKDGSADTSFGENGSTQINYGGVIDAEGRSVDVQTNGKIVVAGNYRDEVNDSINNNFLIVRFNTNGTLDSGFGENGSVITDFGAYDYCSTSNLQDDGKILCAGHQDPNKEGNESNILLARYLGDPVKDTPPLAKKIRRWIHNHILNWQGLQDDDVSYYSIEQSSNGVNGFKEIGRVKKGQRSLVNGQYSYDVSNASAQSSQLTAQSFYRISAVSNDGSNVVSDVISDESVSSITVSPNPVKDVLKIAGLAADQTSAINIISRNGNVLQSAVCNSSVSNINVSQLHAGLYNVQVISNGKTQTVKFVKE